MIRFAHFLPALAIATAGCTSTNAILAKEVDEVFHSKLPPREVAACFEKANHLRVIERPDGGLVAQFRNGYGGVVRSFSIYPEGSGSMIESRHSALGVPGMKWRRCVGIKQARRPRPGVPMEERADARAGERL